MQSSPIGTIKAIKEQLNGDDHTDMVIKVHRCLNLLDLIDSAIISSGTFSTPFDHSLEQLRSELNGMLVGIGHGDSQGGRCFNH